MKQINGDIRRQTDLVGSIFAHESSTRGKSVKMSFASYLGNGRSDQDFLHMLKTIGDLQLFELWYLSLVLKLAM